MSYLPGSFLAEKYRVERVLGRGGMGVVLLATHLQLQQQVAIKLLLPELSSDEKLVARFLQEGRSQVRIQGEHVVRVLDVGTLGTGAPYMVMEFLQGSDLATVAETRGVLPVPEAIDYVLQATEALAQAHSLGIVHRDLKPQNLFLTTRPDGSPLVKVLDFGISKNEMRHDMTRLARGGTTEGSLLGSPSYMSPEQIRNPKDATARSDIWSLGVILYELLTGRMPFEASSLGALLAAISRDRPVDIRAHRPDLPAQIIQVVMRCLSPDPAQRPQDTAELAFALALDAAGHARATRIAQIVQRFSVRPPAFADTVFADTVLDNTFGLAQDHTLRAHPDGLPDSAAFEGSSTVPPVALPMRRLSLRKTLAFSAGAMAMLLALGIGSLSHAHKASGAAEGRATPAIPEPAAPPGPVVAAPEPAAIKESAPPPTPSPPSSSAPARRAGPKKEGAKEGSAQQVQGPTQAPAPAAPASSAPTEAPVQLFDTRQ
jgi:serine/threonine-protein kinase